jgi:ABC-2 type transport system permease protein
VNAFANVRLVAEREIRQRLRGKSFYLSTAIIVAAVLAIGIIHRVAADEGGPDKKTVAVVGAAPAGFEETLQATAAVLDVEVKIVRPADAAAARKALQDKEVTAVVLGEDHQVLHPGEENAPLQAALAQAWATAAVRSALNGAGLSDGEVDLALSAGTLRSETVDLESSGGGKEVEGLALFVGMFSGVLLFIALQMYGGFILMGVVEEKSTAVIEVLLARIRASQLLAGKVLGIGAVAVLQFALLVVAAVASLLISGVDIPGDIWASLPWTLAWFVAGFTMYGFLFAMAGAMVSRQEDAQSAAIPVTVLLTAGYMAMFVFVGDPSLPAAKVVSTFPFFAPLLQPMRIAAGEASLVQMALSVILVVVTIVALAKVAGHVYTRLVLRRGGRVRWGEALRGPRPMS